MKFLLLCIYTTLPFTSIYSFTTSSISSLSFLSSLQVVDNVVNKKTKLFNQSDENDTETNNGNKEEEEEEDPLDSIILSKAQNHFKSNQIYTYRLTTHKPSLGCTAEESLVRGDDGESFVFISKLVSGGLAANAGIEVGDLIVALSGTFDSVEDMFGESIDKVRSLIAGRPEADELVIKVIRNTDVIQKHDSALVDLCILPEGQTNSRDETMEKCIETMYKASYEIDDLNAVEGGCNDEDMECMLDTITDLWSDDFDDVGIGGGNKEKAEEEKEEKKKPAPWSSRSSPSGTYMRVNGTMVNIDE